MNENEVKLGKKKYQELVTEKRKLENAKKELLELQEDSKVKRYIELLDYCKAKSRLEGISFAEKAFRFPALFTNDSNKILIYMGSYRCNLSGKVETFYGDFGGNYVKYKDLETEEVFMVKEKERKNFEECNKVVYLEMDPVLSQSDRNEWEYESAFHILKLEFLGYLTQYSQEESVEKILGNKQKIKEK